MKKEDEICECGHIRLWHVDNEGLWHADNEGRCVFQHNLKHKTKRGEFCKCEKFKPKQKNKK